jgi:hypothetical protein
VERLTDMPSAIAIAALREVGLTFVVRTAFRWIDMQTGCLPLPRET